MRSKIFRTGLPFLIFVIGGSFALSTVTDIRYKLSSRRQDTSDISREMKRKLMSSDRSDDSRNSKKPFISKQQLENYKGDPFVKEALEKVLSVPLPEKLDKNDPDFKEKLQKWKEASRGKPFTLEDYYNKMRETDLNNWENKRIPRPYEEKDETE